MINEAHPTVVWRMIPDYLVVRQSQLVLPITACFQPERRIAPTAADEMYISDVG